MRKFEYVVRFIREEDGRNLTVVCAEDEEKAASIVIQKYNATKILSVKMRD